MFGEEGGNHMSTTAIVVELLVVGLETLAWAILLIGSLFGLDWLKPLAIAFEQAGVLLTMLIVGFAYIVGIVVEQVSDALIQPWEKRIENSTRKKFRSGIWNKKFYIYGHFEQATQQLDYMRSRRRLLRSSILNIALIAIFALMFVWRQVPPTATSRSGLTWFIGTTGATMTILTMFVYRRITEGYFLAIQRVYEAVEKETFEEKST
jgi:hypothetical protein